jgi:molecular chaperone DnaK
VPQIEVTFEIDTDGVVNVSARDLGTGKSQQIRVAASGGLSQDEIQQLVGEAEAHASADQERKNVVELMNKADGLIYSTERTLEEYAEHVGADEREGLIAAVEKARSSLGARDLEALGIAVDELSALSYQMTEQLYAKLGSSGSEPESGAGSD